MRKIKLLAAAALLAVGTSASAQFSNSSSRSARTVSTDGWSTIYVQYNPVSLAFDDDDYDDVSFNGFSFGYNHAFSVSKSIPLFVEAGVGLQYATWSDDVTLYGYDEYGDFIEADGEQKINLFSLKVPVSLMYKWDIPSSKVSLIPFLGVTMRYNLSGKRNDTADDYDYDEDLNLFDEDDMGDKDYTWKRFQLGWQIGVNARISNSFLLGVSYGTDFSEIVKDGKLKTTSVTVGYCF